MKSDIIQGAYQSLSGLLHAFAGPIPEVEAQILWNNIARTHFRVDICIGTVPWSGGVNDVVVSFW